jgi:hypothetical protein
VSDSRRCYVARTPCCGCCQGYRKMLPGHGS